MDFTQLSEQQETLLKKLADTEAENANLILQLEEKEKEVSRLSKCLTTKKVENTKSTAGCNKSLEAHLQGQLRQKEAENSRLSVQMKNLKQAAVQQKEEVKHLREQLTKLKHQESNQQPLKPAARVRKRGPERMEDTGGQLRLQLLHTEKKLADAQSAAETWQHRHSETVKQNHHLEEKISVLERRVSQLTEQQQAVQEKVKPQPLAPSQLQEVTDCIQQCESLLAAYKTQLVNTRAEADDYCARLAQAEQEAQAVQGKLQEEMQEVRGELLGRLEEAHAVCEAVRSSKLQLQNQNKELNITLADLHTKVETQSAQMELVEQKNKVLLEENRQLQQQVETVERKLKESVSQNEDLKAVTNQLELKTSSYTLQIQKLQESLDDAHKQTLKARNDAEEQERSAAAAIFQMRSELISATEEMIKKEQDAALLQTLTHRLEKSEQTNQILQSYITHIMEYQSLMTDQQLDALPACTGPSAGFTLDSSRSDSEESS